MNIADRRGRLGVLGRWIRWAACGAAAAAIAWTPAPAAFAAQPTPAVKTPAPAPVPAPAPAADDKDRWYSVSMGGGRAGYQRTRVSQEDGKITTESEMKISMRRQAAGIEITMSSVFVETKDHKPVSMRGIKNLGSSPVTTDYTFDDGKIKIVTVQGNQSTTETKDGPAGIWLTPAAADIYTAERQAAGAKEIIVRSMDPNSGLEPVMATYTLLEKSTLKALGKTVPVWKYSVKLSNTPGIVQTMWLDEAGTQVKSEMPLLGTLTVMACTREEALKAGDAPELMVATFVKPEGKILNPRHTKSGVYVLSLPDGELPAMPSAAGQRVKVIDKSTAELTVSSTDFAEADAKDAADAKYLSASATLNCDDPEIKKLAARALAKAGESKVDRAETLRRFVHTFITAKNLATGFDTASQVARTKAGDCTEHGVLLAALLRADGVPSRCVSGLIYAEQFVGQRNIFGYHMWAQALLEKDGKKRWVDLDATLPEQAPFDATHIALVGSALGDGDFEKDMAGMVGVLGRLKIQVKETK